MAKSVALREIAGRSFDYWGLVAVLGLLVLAGGGAALYMEINGHWVTGMSNQIVWGMPHVFAVFLIVAASGALNAASISSVFDKKAYKPLAPLSGILALALLAGGLAVLVLDLGRPDRLIVAMTHYNFKSIFAWNIYLYTGFFAVVAVYLWTMLEKRMNGYSKPAGVFAFVWRLILTTGTGSIFGFLVARQAYDEAILAPMFIALSFSYGMAIFLLVVMAATRWSDRQLGEHILGRLRNLLRLFIVAAFYFVAVYHLTNLYITQHHGVERFILADGGIHTAMFWVGQILLGSVLPAAILYHPGTKDSRFAMAVAAGLVIVGGMAQMWVTIIGGQAYPLVMFPGYEVTSSFFDGQIGTYQPTLAEIVLGLGGMALALLLVTLAVKFFKILPETLADPAVDPHHKG